MAEFTESKKRAIKRDALKHDWRSVHQSANSIRSLADEYKLRERDAAAIAEEALANARDKSREYKIRLIDWVAAGVLVLSVLSAVLRSWTPEGMKSGELWGVLISSPWVILMVFFCFLNPKYSQWLVSLTRWWSATLTTILTVVFLFFVQAEGNSDSLKKVVQVLFFALLMMAPVIIVGLISKHGHKKRQEKSALYEKKREILIQGEFYLQVNTMETALRDYGSSNPSARGWLFLPGVLAGALFGYYLRRPRS